MQGDFPASKGSRGFGIPGTWPQRVLFTPFSHSYLFVNLCKLFQVVLKKGNLLLLGVNPPTVLGLHFCTLIKDRGRHVAVWKPNGSHPDLGHASPQQTEGPEDRE